MIGIIHRVSFPWFSGFIFLGIWAAFSTFLHAVLPAEYLFNHLLTSWVNGIVFFLAGTVLGFVYRRNHDLNHEENWRERAHLPQLVLITDYDQIAHLHERISGTDSDKRPNGMLKAVFDSLKRKWCPQSALATLDTKYKIETHRIATRYSGWVVVARVISVCGIFGTLLGVSQSLPSIQNMEVAQLGLHVAFDTSLVIGNAIVYCCRLLQRYDANVLIDVYEAIFDGLIQAIKANKDLHPGERSPVVRKAPWPKKNGTTPKKDSNEKE